MELAPDVPRVAFVNVRVNRRWEDDSNRAREAGVARYPNAMLIDWHSASEDVDRLLRDELVHPTAEGHRILEEWFFEGQVHLNGTGMREYAELLSDVINDQ